MSLNDEEKRAVVAYRLDKANKTLDDAKKVIELELWATAANRCIISKLKRLIWNLEDNTIDFLQCVLLGIMAIALIYKKRMSDHY